MCVRVAELFTPRPRWALARPPLSLQTHARTLRSHARSECSTVPLRVDRAEARFRSNHLRPGLAPEALTTAIHEHSSVEPDCANSTSDAILSSCPADGQGSGLCSPRPCWSYSVGAGTVPSCLARRPAVPTVSGPVQRRPPSPRHRLAFEWTEPWFDGIPDPSDQMVFGASPSAFWASRRLWPERALACTSKGRPYAPLGRPPSP